MAIAQSILDAQARLDAAIAANSAKVDQLLAGQSGAMTPAEIQQVADAITASATTVEATNAKT
jgi:hypothetical protein